MILSSFWRRVLGMSDKTKVVEALGIFERGSNANGDYIKFADGTARCWNSGIAAGATATANGSVFSAASTTSVTFPITFSSVESVSVSANFADRWTGGVASLSTTGFVTLVFRATSSATAVSISYTAIGRWF